jgi:hypothetical protein
LKPFDFGLQHTMTAAKTVGQHTMKKHLPSLGRRQLYDSAKRLDVLEDSQEVLFLPIAYVAVATEVPNRFISQCPVKPQLFPHWQKAFSEELDHIPQSG